MWHLRKIKFIQGFESWQLRFAQALLYGVPLSFLDLGRQQSFDIAEVALSLAPGRLRQRFKLGSDGRQAQLPAMLVDGGWDQGCRRGQGWFGQGLLGCG